MHASSWTWNSSDLSSVLRRITSPEMRLWMQSGHTLTEMIALSSTLLYHSILARSTSSKMILSIQSLPSEILDMILFFAGGTCLQTRLDIQSVCRQFRCLVVLNSAFQTDLASLPLHAAAFFAHFYRAYSRNRSFQLILDGNNIGPKVPPLACLLSGAVFAHTIIVQHTLPTGDLVATLVRQRCCASLRELVLAPVGDFSSARRLLLPLRKEGSVLSIRAPRLRHLALRQMVLDFPETFGLRSLKIDCGSGYDMFAMGDVFRPELLHALLSCNTGLEVVDLTNPLTCMSLDGGPDSRIGLPAVKEFKLATRDGVSMAWLLSRLTLPSEAYLSLKVGEGAGDSVDIPSFVEALMPYMQARAFDTLTVVDAPYRISLLFSKGVREWKGASGSLLPIEHQGCYLLRPGAVDIEICYSRACLAPVNSHWTDVLRAMNEAGFNSSCLKTYEFHGNFHLKRLDMFRVRTLLREVERLRFWPDSAHTIKSSLWQLCAPNPVVWSVVAQNFAALFPKVRSIVDARNGSLWRGETERELLAQVRVLPYHY